MMKKKFDYNQRVWGMGEARLSPVNWGALNLKYCLEALKEVRGRVLEVGCGGGVFTRGIKHHRPDLDLVGLDISQKSIRFARSASSKKIKFIKGDVYRLPFKNDSFEAVVCFDLLEHLEAPEKALGEIKRVLKNEGVFYSVVPLEGSLFTFHGWLWRLFRLNLKEKQIGHIQRFTLRELFGLLERSGLRPVSHKYTRHLFIESVEVIYRFWRHFSNKGNENDPFSAEEELRGLKRSWPKNLLILPLNAIISLSFLESWFFEKIPGHTVGIIAKRIKIE